MQNQSNEDSFKKMFPFFDNVRTVSKITEYRPPETGSSTQLLTPSTQLPSTSSKLTFKELLEYKTFHCDNQACPHNPRTTVANNQYLETELECHGFHHTKDFRRAPIKDLATFTGEFEYQANYFKDGRCTLPKDKYSHNFFESLYHPLYYKQFACKRSYCDQTKYCPYFHSEREKTEWELLFEQNLKVNRKVFLSTKTRHTQDSGYKTPGSPSDESETASRSPLTAKPSSRISTKGAAYERAPLQAIEDTDLFKPFQFAGYQNFYGKQYMPFVASQF